MKKGRSSPGSDCDSSSDGERANPVEDTAMIDTPDTLRVNLSANLLDDAPGHDHFHVETERVADDDDIHDT